MANPTLKSSAPGFANIVAALWVSDEVDQSGTPSKGAWDAKNSVFYPAWGGASMTGVPLGSTTRRGLASTAANCGIDLGLADNHTGTIFDIAGQELTVVALFRRPSTATSLLIQNQESFGAGGYCGWSLSPSGTSSVTGRVRAGNAGANSELAAANTAACPVNELVCIVCDRSSTVTSRIWKNGTQVAGGSAGPNTGDIYYGTPGAYLRRAALFNNPQSRGLSAAPLELFAVIVYNDGDWATGGSALPAMGTSEAALLAGSFHDAYFDFGDGPAVSGDVVLGDVAPAGGLGVNASALGGNVDLADVATGGGLSSGASAISGNVTLDNSAPSGTLGAVPGTFTSEALKDWTGTVQASVALTWFRLYNPSTGALVVEKTGLSTNGSGVVSFSDGAITAASSYAADWLTAGGARRMPVKAAT